MRHNPLTHTLDRRVAERRHQERIEQLNRRAKIPHFRHADIRRTITALNLGD